VASYRRIEVKPIAGALGAEIGNVDLGTLDDEKFREIEAAWLEHLVVFFRNQTLTPEQQIAFAKRFGEIHYHPFMKGMDEHPEILEIIKEEGDTRAFGEVWHTDQMFNPKPAKATILYAKATPDAGGDTLFANMYLAYNALSDPMKEMLKGIKTWNVGDRKKLSLNDEIGSTRDGRYAGNEKMAAKVRDPGDLQTESAHPLVRTHPETGRKALYIGNHTQTLDGLKRAEARPISIF
jgi:taurine dioxygenase